MRFGVNILDRGSQQSVLAAFFAVAAIILTLFSICWSWEYGSWPRVKDGPAEASITLNVSPKEAIVVLDGVDTLAEKRRTPVRSTPGLHHLAISLAGYSGVKDTIPLHEGENPPRSYALSLVPRDRPARAGLVVRTTPPGATISIDGTSVGQTEYTTTAMSPGRYTLRIISADGKNTWEERIVLQASRTLEIPKIDFSRRVMVVVRGIDANGKHVAGYLYIDGQPVMNLALGQPHKTPAQGPVAVGQHRFQVKAEGYEQPGGALIKNIRDNGVEVVVVLRRKAGR